jgi:hypothetical protein
MILFDDRLSLLQIRGSSSACIYAVYNVASREVYIGQTRDFCERMRKHLRLRSFDDGWLYEILAYVDLPADRKLTTDLESQAMDEWALNGWAVLSRKGWGFDTDSGRDAGRRGGAASWMTSRDVLMDGLARGRERIAQQLTDDPEFAARLKTGARSAITRMKKQAEDQEYDQRIREARRTNSGTSGRRRCTCGFESHQAGVGSHIAAAVRRGDYTHGVDNKS